MNKTFILGFIPLVIIIAILVVGYSHHPPQQQLPNTITFTSTTHANNTTINGTRTQQTSTSTPTFRQQIGMGMLQIVLLPFNVFYYALENVIPYLPSQFYLAFMIIVAFTIPSIFANIFVTHRRLLLFVVYLLWFIFLVALFTYT